ncbi:MAG: hypothetical protein K2M97_06535 [Muribaculaceae bacterium]|nr:hypothetical protein [Muribaculaceae bacterium]
MKTIETHKLGEHAYAVALPGVILAFDPAGDPLHQLSALISANPGVPVVVLCTRYDSQVFSQAETTDRTFVFSAADISRTDVPEGASVSWVSPGDILPVLPGDVSVTALGSGFLVEKLGTDTRVIFSPVASDAVGIDLPMTVAILPEGTAIKATTNILY